MMPRPLFTVLHLFLIYTSIFTFINGLQRYKNMTALCFEMDYFPFLSLSFLCLDLGSFSGIYLVYLQFYNDVMHRGDQIIIIKKKKSLWTWCGFRSTCLGPQKENNGNKVKLPPWLSYLPDLYRIPTF